MLPGRSKTCVNLSLEQRLDILRQLEDRVPQNQLAKNYGISVVTIHRIKKNAVQIRQQSQTPGTEGKKRFRRPVLDELDTRLYTWYQQRRAVDQRITNAILQEKAVELNEEFGGPSSFSASNGWIWRFKQRHCINFHDSNNENSLIDTRTTEEFAQRFLQRLEQEGIKLQNLYSMDETGLSWKCLPSKTLIHTTRVYGKKNKHNLVTIGLCANAIGTHKLPPLFIHRCATPRALKHCWDRLPVIFKAQKNAWMSQNVFADWLEKHFKPAVRNQQFETGTRGKVLLLIDKRKAHSVLPQQLQMEDNDIEVVYFPANASSSLQPMRQGIMKSVKISFRRRMLSRILNFPAGVLEFYADYDIKDCIDLVNEAWTDVTQVDIYNSWKKLLRFGPTAAEETGEGHNKENPGDTLDVTMLKDTVKTIVKEAVSHKEIEEWLSICEKAESDPNDLEAEEEDYPDERATVHLDVDEIERIIANLILWSETQSDFVKLHARVVKDYYDLMH
ncbi:jerky protein homolog-like [Colletes gigas]|uniref:jerky protein homolog-like n=1 Tax=Colletes gigas TaxID=935657 RepID=UPI001C9B8C92|nr:jerky protein homolog-like [Colletes gigas]